MKKLLFWASLVAIVIGFAACNNDDVDVPRFQFDADGRCYWADTKPISHADFLKYAEGKGWKQVSSYEIKEDGSVAKTDFFEGLSTGIVGSFIEKDMFFTSQKTGHVGLLYFENSYVYSEDGNLISFERSDGSLFDKYQVLSIDDHEIKMISNEGLRSWNDARPTYTLTTYQKMTEEEQLAFRKKYDEYMSGEETHYLAYSVKDGVLQMRMSDFTIDCGAEGVEYAFKQLENGVVQVDIAEVGENSANCFGYIDLDFTVPGLKMGETYQFDVRVKKMAGGAYYSYFKDFSIEMKEGSQGKIFRD